MTPGAGYPLPAATAFWREPHVKAAASTAYRIVIAIFAAGVVVQFFLAGLGVFRAQHDATTSGTLMTEHRFDNHFHAHIVLGDLLLLVGLVAFLLALLARLDRRATLLTLLLPVLVFVQSVLANAGPPGLRALHPVNALNILGISGRLAHSAWRPGRGPATDTAAQPV